VVDVREVLHLGPGERRLDEKKRAWTVSGERPSWNPSSAGPSAGAIGRTWTVPPSASTTSAVQ
jgi:hypothetical protein